MLELSVRRGQSNFSTVYIFCYLRRKRLLSWLFDRKGWFWQPLNFASAASVCNGLKQRIFFFGAFSIFESGGITKHLITGPSGNSEFCFPSTSMFSSASSRGTLSVSGNQNSLFPLWPVIKCLLFNPTFYETNFKPKLFTANVECNGTVLKEPKTEKAILCLNLNSRSMVVTLCFGSLSTLLYTSDLKWHWR